MRSAFTAAAALFVAATLLCASAVGVSAQGLGKALTVGVKTAPPFAMKDANGEWYGLAVDLWTDMSKLLDTPFELREYGSLEELLTAVETGEADVGAAALTVTVPREKKMDFSHPFFFTGLGIAVPTASSENMFALLADKLLSPVLLAYCGSLLLLLLIVGLVIWLVEKRNNTEHFAEGRRGIIDGMWWSAVTMTTVGYGDIAPKTLRGRLLGLFWMFASVMLLSVFTAGVTSSLTVDRLGDKIKGPDDLPNVRVGSVRGSSSEEFLESIHVAPEFFVDVPAGLKAVQKGKVDAFVYDRPIITYCIRKGFVGKVRMLDSVFDYQSYAYAFPRESALRKPVNVVMLELLSDRGYVKNLFGPYHEGW